MNLNPNSKMTDTEARSLLDRLTLLDLINLLIVKARKDMPIDQFVSVGKGFVLMHKHCQKPEAPSKQVPMFGPDPLGKRDPGLQAMCLSEFDDLGIDGSSDEPDPETDPPPARHGEGPLLDPIELRHLVTCVRPKEFWPSVQDVESWHEQVRADVQRWCRVELARSHPIAGRPVPMSTPIPNVLSNIEYAAKPRRARKAKP